MRLSRRHASICLRAEIGRMVFSYRCDAESVEQPTCSRLDALSPRRLAIVVRLSALPLPAHLYLPAGGRLPLSPLLQARYESWREEPHYRAMRRAGKLWAKLDGERTHDRCVGICYLDGQDISEVVVRHGLAPRMPCGARSPHAAAARGGAKLGISLSGRAEYSDANAAFFGSPAVASCRSDGGIEFQIPAALAPVLKPLPGVTRLPSAPNSKGEPPDADFPTRRDFLASASSAAAAGVLGPRGTLADEGPPEVTTIRIGQDPRHLHRAAVHRRGAAARGRLHRCPLRANRKPVPRLLDDDRAWRGRFHA